MKFSIQLGTLLVSYLTSSAHAWPKQHCPNVLYTLVNDPEGASIASLCVQYDGTISGTQMTPTGGKGLGGSLGPGKSAGGNLFGDDSVFIDKDYLFTVNAGSNTVSVFAIDKQDPMHPRLIGKPAGTLGEFPMSVAYSDKIKTACVLNGGAVAGVTCFSVDPVKGLTVQDKAPRSISKALHQTTPPVGPVSTAADIVFNPSSSALIVSVKGTPMTTPVTPGYIFAWAVRDGKVAEEGTATQLSKVIVDFSLTFLGNDFSLLITDAAVGADILSVSSSLTFTELLEIEVPGQKAICWSRYDPRSETVFLIDTGSPNITVVSAVDGSIVHTINFDGKGGLDSTMIGTALYTVTPDNTVLYFRDAGVANAQYARNVQNFKPDVPNPKNLKSYLSGLAAWPANPSYYD